MDRQKKLLLCMYVDDFCGMKEESFNFYIERRYTVREGEIHRKSREEIEGFPNDFWGNNVSAVTLLIGENGAGKTTLMRLLIKWLCQLSVGHIPQEKGALVISVEDRDKLIAFDSGGLWKIEINHKGIVRIEDINEVKELLKDIRLAYYTDTMTDLELSDTLTAEELDFLQDDSLLTRISNSMKGRYTPGSIKDCIKREEFARQMQLFWYSKEKPDIMPEFPIRYMKFMAIEAGDKKDFERVLDGNHSLIGEVNEFWNGVFADHTKDNLPDIAKALLWGLFSGAVTSLIQWERTLPNLTESIVTGSVGSSLRAFMDSDYNDWNTRFKNLFTNMFRDCEETFKRVHRYEEFREVWGKQVEHDINNFLDALKELEDGKFFGKWRPSENAQNVWEFKLEYFDDENKNEKQDGNDRKEERDKKAENEQPGLIQNWKNLWEHYLAVAHLMPGCRFDWKYASSGRKNKSNLYTNLYNIISKRYDSDTQLWVLLDEPDNTFHPDWKRRIIQELLDICSDFKNHININFQLFISTHSPIMLSDVPKQAVILMKIGEKKENDNITKEKQQKSPESSPFGQQIYTLYNDAFFMERGIIGAFADRKIGEVYSGLCKIEEQISKSKSSFDEDKWNDFEQKLEKYRCIIKLIEEPLLHGLLSQSYKSCKRRIKELR